MTIAADVVDGRSNIYRWDINTLTWVVWDGSLTVGALTIGTVNQGAAGVSPWLISYPALLAELQLKADLTETQPVSIAATAAVEQTGLSAGALNADLVPSVNVSAYKWFALQVTGTWVGTLTFQASNDNINFVSTVVASAATASSVTTTVTVDGIFTGPCNFKYLRVRMTAYTSGTATGNLQLYPVASALNVAGAVATQAGTWTVQPGNTANTTAWKTQLLDAQGYLSSNSPLNEQVMVEPTRVLGSQFVGTTIDPNFWTPTTANSATVTQVSSEIILTSGTNSAASAQLHSVQLARVIAGVSQQWRGGIQVNNIGIANNVRRWGVAWGATMPTISDGAFFKLTGTTFQIVTMKGGTETAVSSGSFNGDVTSYTMTTNLTTYEIFYTQNSVRFVIGGVTVHTVSGAVANWSNQINLHCYIDNINSGNTTSVAIDARFAVVRRFGKESTVPVYRHIAGATTTILKYGPGTLHNIVVGDAGTLATVYDNTAGSGTVISVLDTSAAAAFGVAYESPFYTGLTVVTTGAGTDLTVIYE